MSCRTQGGALLDITDEQLAQKNRLAKDGETVILEASKIDGEGKALTTVVSMGMK
jgi:hypothetical protein